MISRFLRTLHSSERGSAAVESTAIWVMILLFLGQAVSAIGQKSPVPYAQIADCLAGGGTDIIVYADSEDICQTQANLFETTSTDPD